MVDGRSPLELPSMLAAAMDPASAGADDLDYGEDAGGDDETEMVMLQKVLQQTLEKQRATAAKKQTQMLDEFKAGVDKRVAAVEAAITKDSKDCAALAKATYAAVSQRLTDKVKQMEAVSAKYQQEMATLWEQYQEEHSALESAEAKIKMTAEQKKQGVKRRIAALSQETEASLAEARKKTEAVKGRAAKMPQLAKLLQSLM